LTFGGLLFLIATAFITAALVEEVTKAALSPVLQQRLLVWPGTHSAEPHTPGVYNRIAASSRVARFFYG